MRSLRHSLGKYLVQGDKNGKWLGLDWKPSVCLQSLGPSPTAQTARCPWLFVPAPPDHSCSGPAFVMHLLVYLSLVVLRRYNLVWCCAKAHCGFTQPTKEWLCSISRSAGKERAGQERHPTNTALQPKAPELETTNEHDACNVPLAENTHKWGINDN